MGLEHMIVESLLGIEVIIDHGLVNAGPVSDAVDPGSGEPEVGKLIKGSRKDSFLCTSGFPTIWHISTSPTIWLN
jgi:hypothetical protein